MQFVAFERAKQVRVRAAVCAFPASTPGIVYGGAAEAQMIEIDHNALWHALKKKPSTQHPGHGTQRPDQQGAAA